MQTHRAPVIFQSPASPFKSEYNSALGQAQKMTLLVYIIASSYLTRPHRASLVQQSHLNYIYAAANVLGYFRENVP